VLCKDGSEYFPKYLLCGPGVGKVGNGHVRCGMYGEKNDAKKGLWSFSPMHSKNSKTIMAELR
jgi:hypothetical protein